MRVVRKLRSISPERKRLITTYYLLTTTYYLLPTTYYLLTTTYSLLPTHYSLLSTTAAHVDWPPNTAP